MFARPITAKKNQNNMTNQIQTSPSVFAAAKSVSDEIKSMGEVTIEQREAIIDSWAKTFDVTTAEIEAAL